MARFHPGCSGWLIYCPKLEACWQWKTVWRFPRADGGFKEQPEVRNSREEIESAFLEGHWWDRGESEIPLFEWHAMTAEDAQQRRIEQIRQVVAETPGEIEELERLGASEHAGILRERLKWYRSELAGFRALSPNG